ncbi:MAG: hypothetical protein F9K18_02885 [Thermoanaerobaculia bacterium]|nr:MAG: hypothetical protein F9K18_02885 [Thermoanaerobaculia bacterium]
MRRARIRCATAALVALALAAAPARAWLAEGHRAAVRGALRLLPADLPESFSGAGETLADLAVDPDLFRNPATPALAGSEAIEHYLDVERLADGAWPASRAEHLASLQARGLAPAEAGSLPWAIEEASERLTVAFALLRRDGGDAAARAQALVQGGRVAHHAADAIQPLHTTVHHDGWALPLGGSPLEGHHVRVDALLERVRFDREGALAGVEARAFADTAAAVRSEILASHALIDRTYRLAPLLARPEGYARPEAIAYACERYAAAARFVASLWLTAWERSARLELPDWARQTAKE